MKKYILIIAVVCITMGMVLISSAIASAQTSNEFTVPLSDPAKRGKLKAHLNYGSITVKGTARKDVLVKYKALEDGEDEGDHDHDDDDDEASTTAPTTSSSPSRASRRSTSTPAPSTSASRPSSASRSATSTRTRTTTPRQTR